MHAVSHDGRFGKGLAAKVEEKYQVREQFLKDKGRGCPGLSVVHNPERTIVNLVTKLKYYEKPIPTDVAHTIYLLKEWMSISQIKTVCMPAISCGLDEMKLEDVVAMLYKEFQQTDDTIYMYLSSTWNNKGGEHQQNLCG